jgi:hypothetical protein
MMAGKNLSEVTTFGTAITADDLFYMVDSSLSTLSDRKVKGSMLYQQTNKPYVYVGSSAQCQYANIPDAVTAGEHNLYVVTDIAVTSDCTFSGNLEIRVANNITITWTDASIIGATGVSAVIIFNFDGVCNWSFDNFTASRTVINLDNIAPSPPSGMKGYLFIINNSNSSFNIKPVSNRIGSDHLFYMEYVMYLPPLNSGSYFDIEVLQAGTFIAIGQQTSGQTALKVTSSGTIGMLYFSGDFSSASYVVEGLNALTILSCENKTPSNTTSIYLKNSVIQNVSGLSDLNVYIESSAGILSSVENSSAISIFPSGSITNIVIKSCSISGFNDSSLLSGKVVIDDCLFSGTLTFSSVNGAVDYSISNTTINGGVANTLSWMKIANCTAGNINSSGTPVTFNISAGSDSVQISNCIADSAIVDNGTNSAYSYKIF